MNYKALYRKYRPKKFDEVKDQEHIVRTLKNIIANNTISHAYLFSGPRGVGKTSIAKIFANSVNCIHTEKPWDICDECLKNTNNNLNIIEMDAASNNGVEEVRFLQEKIEFLPTYGRYKVYIIDEVHMLTKSAFNALLKTLEEPPSHVIFIFATTDPQKIPLTILSRTQRYNFVKIKNQAIIERLKDVLEKENISYEQESLPYIARLADGSLRDALSFLEQTIAYGNGQINFKDTVELFGLISNNKIIQILNNLYFSKLKEALAIFKNVENSINDPSTFINSSMTILKDFIIYQKTYETELLEYLQAEDFKEIKFNYEFAINSLEHLYKLHKEIFYQENSFQLIEFYLVKMLNKNNNKEINNEKTNKTIDLDQKTKEILLRHKEITKEIEMDENELKKMYDEENKSIKKVEDIIQKTLEISIDLQNQAEENKNIENDILNFEDNYNQGLISSAEYEMPLLETGIDNSFPKLKNYINKTSFNNYLKDQELLLSLIAKAYSKDAFIQFKEQFNNWKNNLEDIVTNLDRYGDFIKVIKDIDISLTIVGPNFVIFTNKKNTHIGFLNYLYEVLESKEIQNDIIESHLGNKIKFYFIENIEEIKKAIDHFNTLNTEEKNKYKELSIENNFKKKDNKLLSFFKKAAATKKGK